MLDSSDHLKNLAFAVPQSPETPRPLAAPSHRGPSHRLQARMPKPIPLFPLDDTPEDSGQDQRDITKTADQSLDERPAVVDPGMGQSHGSDPDGLPDRKPSICAGVMAHDEQRDQTWQALLDGNYRPGTDDFRCYRRHGRLVFTQKDDGGADVICEFDDATMRNLLSDRIAWYVVDRSGQKATRATAGHIGAGFAQNPPPAPTCAQQRQHQAIFVCVRRPVGHRQRLLPGRAHAAGLSGGGRSAHAVGRRQVCHGLPPAGFSVRLRCGLRQRLGRRPDPAD